MDTHRWHSMCARVMRAVVHFDTRAMYHISTYISRTQVVVRSESLRRFHPPEHATLPCRPAAVMEWKWNDMQRMTGRPTSRPVWKRRLARRSSPPISQSGKPPVPAGRLRVPKAATGSSCAAIFSSSPC